MINIMLIGCGPHARRIHIPIIEKEKKNLNARFSIIIDINKEKDIVKEYLTINKVKYDELILLNNKEQIVSNNKLSDSLIFKLNNLVKKYSINAVFISTEPSVHVPYAKWALENGISILMDKPISAPLNLSVSEKSVEQISRDYYELLDLYRKQKIIYPDLVFELMTQRRYHFAFLKIRDLIDEVAERTGVPITSFQSTHCDGQWRMPSEIIEQNYHPYNQGYGKCSHSGYHSIDIMDWLVRSSIKNQNQKIKKFEVISNFMYPNDFINQLPYEKYSELFKENEPIKYSKDEYQRIVKDYGEIDAQIQVAFKNSNDEITTLGQYNLLHNSFSQRNWPSAKGRDLYKGNGRIRHELHYIVQGPFQTIIYESYQSEEILNEKTNHSNVGGEYHLDIHIFRNSKMFQDWKSYEKITINDFDNHILKGYSRGHQEDARRNAIITFINSLSNKNINRLSDIEDQQDSIDILYSIYKSALLRKKGRNPLVILEKNKYLYQKLNEKPYPVHQYMDEESINWLKNNLNIKYSINKVKCILNRLGKFPIDKLDIDISAYEKYNGSGIHGVRHQFRTALYTWIIIKYFEISFDEDEILELLQSVLYHDILRENDNTDLEHGRKSSIWIMKKYPYIRKSIIKAIVNHDIDIEKMSVYDKIVKTADALDRYRLPKAKWWIKKEYMLFDLDDNILEVCKYITYMIEKSTCGIDSINDIVRNIKICLEKLEII